MQTQQFQLHADIEEQHWWFVARRRIMRQIATELLPPSTDVTVVDVGCGTGANIAALAGRWNCIGIDTSAEAIELARQRFPAVRFLAGRAPADLGEWMGRARLVMLMDVLEHVADDFAMLGELLSAASPGTFFLLTVPADESLWSEHDESFGHYRRYDRRRLERVWEGLPVTTFMVSHFNARLLPVVRLVRALGRLRGRTAGRAGTDFWLPARPVNRALEAVLAGEAGRLLGQLHGASTGYSSGSSLVAVLRREKGDIPIRKKPADLPPDHRVE